MIELPADLGYDGAMYEQAGTKLGPNCLSHLSPLFFFYYFPLPPIS